MIVLHEADGLVIGVVFVQAMNATLRWRSQTLPKIWPKYRLERVIN